jgi:membrane dipeptidase
MVKSDGDESNSIRTSGIRWESHACLPLIPNQDMAVLLRYQKAGFHHVSVNVGMDMTPFPTVMQVIAGFRAWIAQHPEKFILVQNLTDIFRARDQNKLAVSFDLEGSNMLLQNSAMVALFASLGIKQMLLAYNRDNSCAGGCHGSDTGLSPFGREIVVAINMAGIIMDCSHASKRSSIEIMEMSQRPVVFSHTNIKAIFDHPRTIDDEQILACAASDGVIGLTGLGIFLGDPKATVDAFVRQIDYLAERVGVAHIGLGLDTELCPGLDDLPEGENQETWWPSDFYGVVNIQTQLQPEQLSEIARALERLGYLENEINAILGDNFVRVAKATWRQA